MAKGSRASLRNVPRNRFGSFKFFILSLLNLSTISSGGSPSAERRFIPIVDTLTIKVACFGFNFCFHDGDLDILTSHTNNALIKVLAKSHISLPGSVGFDECMERCHYWVVRVADQGILRSPLQRTRAYEWQAL